MTFFKSFTEEQRQESKPKPENLPVDLCHLQLSIETKFGGLEKRFEELEIASKLRRRSDIEIKHRSIDHMNNWDDETSSESEQSNC